LTNREKIDPHLIMYYTSQSCNEHARGSGGGAGKHEQPHWRNSGYGS